jgi:glucosamine--fructose-6-phosphate aminotransferase (isomerizing)
VGLKSEIRAMMLNDILTQGERVAEQVPRIISQIQSNLAPIDVDKLQAVYLVGCGDSYYAGHAVRHAFDEWTGLRVEPVEALEFARYVAPRASSTDLVVATSVSGQVGRTLECVESANRRGLPSIAITGTPASRITELTDAVIDHGIRVREPGPVPQTVHYLANQTTLLLTALLIGQARGVVSASTVESHLQAIVRVLRGIHLLANTARGPIAAWVRERQAPEPLVIVGAGPNYATALFATAKLIEAALVLSVPQELEEWAHEQYFLTGPRLPTVLIAAPGPSEDRLVPTARAIASVGGECVAIGPPRLAELASVAGTWWATPECPEALSPLLFKVPIELLAWAYSEQLDRRPFNYDSDVRRATVETAIYREGLSAEAVNRRAMEAALESAGES